MRKKNTILPALFFAAGIVGMILRNIQVDTVFDPVSRLADASAPVSAALLWLSLAVAAGAMIFALPLKKELGDFDPLYAFPVRGGLEFGAITALSAAVGVCAILNFVLDKTETAVVKGIFAALGAVAAVSITLASKTAVIGKPAKAGILSVVPPLFAAFWLVVTYKDNNTNPVLLEYCWRCLAMASAAAAFYYDAGYDYGKRTVRRTVIAHCLAMYFCLVTTMDAGNAALSIAYAATAGLMLMRLWIFLSGRQPVVTETVTEEDSEADETEDE